MKYENYLVHFNNKGYITFKLARGYKLKEDSRLAYCKMVDPETFNYAIIDVASGLYVIRATSKKKLLEAWKEKNSNPEFIEAIIRARKSDNYLKRIEELTAEKRIWRESGYLIEGR